MKAPRTFSVTARSWRLLAVVLTGFALWGRGAEARETAISGSAGAEEGFRAERPGSPQTSSRAAAKGKDRDNIGALSKGEGKRSAPDGFLAQNEKAQGEKGTGKGGKPGKGKAESDRQGGKENPEASQPPATGPPAVPVGGLAAHEKAGGHLISRHTGKSEAELVERLRGDPQIVSCSSFTSRQVAEAIAGLMISRRQKEIAAWMRSGQDRLALDMTLNKPAGITVSRKTWKAEPARSVRLILQRDAGFPGGWRILTGYPQT